MNNRRVAKIFAELVALTVLNGVQQARRGWCDGWRVVNTLPFEEFRSVMSLPKSERYERVARHA